MADWILVVFSVVLIAVFSRAAWGVGADVLAGRGGRRRVYGFAGLVAAVALEAVTLAGAVARLASR